MKLKRILAVILALALALALSACGGNTSSSNSGSSPATGEGTGTSGGQTSDPGTEEGKFGTYYIGYNNFATGIWELDFCLSYAQSLNDNLGNELNAPSADFSADKMQSDVQNLISAGVDGLIYYGSFPTLTPVVSEMCQEGQVAFGMFDQMPTGDLVDELQANPYFAGAVGANAYDVGYQMGETAASMGYQRALIIGGAVGDAAHDGRVEGFTDGFEAGGGSVIGVARCSSPAEAVTKADDLLSAYTDADCIYGCHGDYISGSFTAMANRGVQLMGFCTGIDSTLFDEVADGKLIGDGGTAVAAALAYCLVENMLDGHPILDENGKAPVIDDLMNFLVTPENVDLYQKYWVDDEAISFEGYQKLLYRYNNELTYDDFVEFVQNYSLDSIVAEK